MVEFKGMPARKLSARNSNLEEAMALLIRNQAAFVEQIARNDRERLELQARSEQRHLEHEQWRREVTEWQSKVDRRLDRIEAELRDLPRKIVESVLDQLPRIKKEIG